MPDATSRTRKPRISNNPPPTSKATAIAQPSGAEGKPTLLMYAVVGPKAASLPSQLKRNGRPISMRPTSGRYLVTSMFDSRLSGDRKGDDLTTISRVISLSFTIVKYHHRWSPSMRTRSESHCRELQLRLVQRGAI